MPNKTTKRGQGPKDGNVLAWEIVQQATEQQAKPDPNAGKDPKRVTAGKLGGLKGGAARKAALTPEHRKEIAKKAAEKRWGKA